MIDPLPTERHDVSLSVKLMLQMCVSVAGL
jgi:hypothetical protein